MIRATVLLKEKEVGIKCSRILSPEQSQDQKSTKSVIALAPNQSRPYTPLESMKEHYSKTFQVKLKTSNRRLRNTVQSRETEDVTPLREKAINTVPKPCY